MGRTFVQQDTQVYSSDTYNDALTAGSTLQSGAANLQDDLNSLRSQVKRVIHSASAGNWYDAIPTVNSKTRAILQLNTDLDDIETKRVLFRTQILTDVTVPTSQNFVVLSVVSAETPTTVGSVDAATTEGFVVAFHTGTFGTHSLDLVAGPNAISPKNLCVVRLASTGQVIQSSTGKDIYAFIQSETATNGFTPNDTSQQVQLSFVMENSAGSGLIACSVADIENKVINYSYVRRMFFDNVPEEAFLSGAFLDQTASTDVTLNNAIDNQSGPATQVQNIAWRINDAFALDFEDSTGTRDLLKILPSAVGDAVTVDADTITFTNPTNATTFTNGVSFDTTGTTINVGVTAGQVDSAGALNLFSGGVTDIRLFAGREIYFDDANQSSSTWSDANGVKLSDTTAEWDDYEVAFGEVSLLNAIVQAKNLSSRTKGVAVVTTNSPADTNMTGAGGTPNLDAILPAYVSGDFLLKVDVYLNGTLLRNGANSAANNDVYPGTTPANGDLKFEFALRGGAKPDVITVVMNG